MHHCIRHRNYNNNATTATTTTTTTAAPSLRSTASSTSTPEAPAQELLTIYELPPSFASEPKHLTPIDPATILPTGSRLPIDAAHRNGLLHAGSVLYVADASGKLLFLRRSPTLVTCPSKWSILGEHSTAGEEVVETAVRGIEEELGFVASGLEERDDAPGTWTAELRPAGNRGKNRKEEEEEEEGGNGSSSSSIIRVTISNATEFPLYYVRHYGPRNDNRVDRQLTYTHLVKFPKKHTEIEWKLDE